MSDKSNTPDKWGDRDDEWTSAIDAAHPIRSGDHKAYETALEMVGNRHSKGSLVELVCWLIQRATAPQVQSPAVVEVPAGYAVVPLEPTQEMLMAGARSIIDGQEGRPGSSWADEANDAYRAMLAAAPTQQGAEPSDAQILDWLERKMFEHKSNGNIGDTWTWTWTMACPHRHELQKFKGFSLREAIRAAMQSNKGASHAE